MFGQLLATRFAVPLLERFVRDLAFNEQLRELAPLGLAFERHQSPINHFAAFRARIAHDRDGGLWMKYRA
jgi:hypothetical protein